MKLSAVCVACLGVLTCHLDTRAQNGPVLTITSDQGQRFILSWPDSIAGFVLEGTRNVSASGSWRPIAEAPIHSGGRYSLPIDPVEIAQYFRLRMVSSGTGELPPDPATVSSKLPPHAAFDFADATAFLYSGPKAIQTGIVPGVIEPRRAAVLRGRTLTREGQPLAGVTVSILRHRELGQTLTREDGFYDLAVNGGALLTMDFRKEGYLPVQRQVQAIWRDFTTVDDVVLVPPDTKVTTILLGVGRLANTDPCQGTVQGSPVTDADGTRTTTLFVPATLRAVMTLQNGEMQSLDRISLRFTEFSQGSLGEKALPGTLPKTAAYGFAAELSVDEAIAEGATDVRFSEPVISYTENFLKLPVGTSVPAGSYDRAAGQWVPSENGRVIQVLDTVDGNAIIDLDGSGNPATAEELAAAGINDCERVKMSVNVPRNQPLMRLPHVHGRPHCLSPTNWRLDIPSKDAEPRWIGEVLEPDPSECDGSIIDAENQVLRQHVRVTGTQLNLVYHSGRVPGRKAARTLGVPVGFHESEQIDGLRRLDVEMHVAGRRYTNSFPGNQVATFEWDGKDVYGRQIQSAQKVRTRIGYVYDAVYGAASAFGNFPNSTNLVSEGRSGQETIVWYEQHGILAPWDARMVGLAGWTLGVHHFYDPVAQILYLGTGRQRGARGSDPIITTIAGTGERCGGNFGCFGGDDGPALLATLDDPIRIACAADGTLYVSDSRNARVRRIAPDGMITTVAGTGLPGYSGDGGPATLAQISRPHGIAVGPDGSLYFADPNNQRVRRVDSRGIISTVAGNGTAGFNGDGIPAVDAQLNYPEEIAVAPDGSLYVACFDNPRIRRIAPDGIIWTVAGTGFPPEMLGQQGDRGLATEAPMRPATGLAVSPDGALYIGESFSIRRIGTDGIIERMAGVYSSGYSGDGDLSFLAQLRDVNFAFSPEGSLYLFDAGSYRVRRIAMNGFYGIINTVAGSLPTPFRNLTPDDVFAGDHGPAAAARLNFTGSVAVGPEGSIYVADRYNHRIRKIHSPWPTYAATNITIPSEDGIEIYEFTRQGRHLRTRHALTGAILFEFAYDAQGRLVRSADGDGNVTHIEREGSSTTAIVAPFGQRTTLSVDENGFLASITNPAGDKIEMTTSSDGLMASWKDARGAIHRFTYDSLGRLIKDENPAGGFLELSRDEQPGGTSESFSTYTARVTTPLGRTYRYQVDDRHDDRIQTTARGSGFLNASFSDDPNGVQRALDTGDLSDRFAEGTLTTRAAAPDPRWGMLAPYARLESVTILPARAGSLSNVLTRSRSAQLLDTNNVWSLASQMDVITVNGLTGTNEYQAATRTFFTTTPGGRRISARIDPQGRPVQVQLGHLHPATFQYDDRGRLIQSALGAGDNARIFTYGYAGQSYLGERIDPLGRRYRFARDAAGRITQTTLPDGGRVEFQYDANGNRTSITPPGQPAHTFSYDALNFVTGYSPPTLPRGSSQTVYTRNIENELTRIARADGRTIEYEYQGGFCDCGVLSKITFDRGVISYFYDNRGRVMTVAAPGGIEVEYRYLGHLVAATRWSGPVSGEVLYDYDTDFRFKTIQVNGTAVAFSYDADGLLLQAGDLSLQYERETGLPQTSKLSGVTDAWTYNGFAEPITYGAAFNGAILYTNQFTRDSLGRITERSETIAGVRTSYNYEYDPVGRLTNVIQNGTSKARYSYDLNGNRLTLATDADPMAAQFDAHDRLLALEGPGGNSTFAYNASGDLTNRIVAGQTTAYSYDALGRLVRVALPDGRTIEYLIDGAQRRLGKLVNGQPTMGWLYQDGLRPVAELDGANNVVSRFVYGSRLTTPEYMVRRGRTFRILVDHVGSPRLVVDAQTGEVAQRVDYDEFGNVTRDSNPGFQPFGFAGGLYDPDTGLVRFGAREYDAPTGRWMSRDPLLFDADEANLYVYARNDPVNFIDPDGLKCRFKLKFRFRIHFGHGGFEISAGIGGHIEVGPLKADLGAGGGISYSHTSETSGRETQTRTAFSAGVGVGGGVRVDVGDGSLSAGGQFGPGYESTHTTHTYENFAPQDYSGQIQSFQQQQSMLIQQGRSGL